MSVRLDTAVGAGDLRLAAGPLRWAGRGSGCSGPGPGQAEGRRASRQADCRIRRRGTRLGSGGADLPRYPIREARGLLDKVLVAAPGSAGGWRPTWSAWSIESGSRSASTRRQSPGNCCYPGRAEPRSDRWTSSPGAGPAEAGAEPPDRSGRVLARRAELGRELDDPPSEVRGLIERHEQLRGWRTRIW